MRNKKCVRNQPGPNCTGSFRLLQRASGVTSRTGGPKWNLLVYLRSEMAVSIQPEMFSAMCWYT
jgi:hypothetical protein